MGVLSSLGATASTANAWSDADGNVYPADCTVDEDPLTVSQVCSWEEEFVGNSQVSPSDLPPQTGHGDPGNSTMAASEDEADVDADGDLAAGVGSGEDWFPPDAEGDDEDYDVGAKKAPPWARRAPEEPLGEDAALGEVPDEPSHPSSSSSTHPSSSSPRSRPIGEGQIPGYNPQGNAPSWRDIAEAQPRWRKPKLPDWPPPIRGSASSGAKSQFRAPSEDSSAAPWKRHRTV